MATTSRLLTLLSLLQARRDWPGSVLASRLDVSDRTVRRDIDRLREMGYRIETTMGPDGGYRLDAGAEMPPLLFDDDQALAVAIALRAAPALGADIGEAAVGPRARGLAALLGGPRATPGAARCSLRAAGRAGRGRRRVRIRAVQGVGRERVAVPRDRAVAHAGARRAAVRGRRHRHRRRRRALHPRGGIMVVGCARRIVRAIRGGDGGRRAAGVGGGVRGAGWPVCGGGLFRGGAAARKLAA